MNNHKLIIQKLGPIEDCELTISSFMVLTGAQASGKSTIAKAIFFFRTIKNDIFKLLKADDAGTMVGELAGLTVKNQLIKRLKDKFFSVFGSSWGMENEMLMEYYFSDTCYVKVHLNEEIRYNTPNYLWIDLSEPIIEFLKIKRRRSEDSQISFDEKDRDLKELENLFNDNYETVYIPAGRGLISILCQQIAYIYTVMEEEQKRTIDSCTRDYIERILKVRYLLQEGIDGLQLLYTRDKKNGSEKIINLLKSRGKSVLNGDYKSYNGEERIELENNKKKYVKLNFASSGQQEAVWIINLLCYYTIFGKKANFVIEEPESNLFPTAQEAMTELIALSFNAGNSALVTTHSPYILGTLNNLLYASSVSRKIKNSFEKVEQIIPSACWIDRNNFSAWFIRAGRLENGMDTELGLIQNEKIDEISRCINENFDALFDLESDGIGDTR